MGKGHCAEQRYHSSCQQRDVSTPYLCLQAKQGGNPSQLQGLVGWQPCSSTSPSTTLCPTWKTSSGSVSTFTFFPALVVSPIPQDNTDIKLMPAAWTVQCPLPTMAFPTGKLRHELLLPLRRHQSTPVPPRTCCPQVSPAAFSVGWGWVMLVSPPLASHSAWQQRPPPAPSQGVCAGGSPSIPWHPRLRRSRQQGWRQQGR